MRKESKDFLFQLLTTPSPTGYEQPIQKVVKSYAKGFADSMEGDLHGNLIIGVNPKAKRRIMLAGHCDQIGFMVTHIANEGYVYVSALGGIDTGVLPGSHVTIHAKKGPIHGVFGRKPIHLQTEEERGKAKIDIDKSWIDIGAKNKKEAEKLVQIGDCATFKLGVTELRNNLVCSPGLDDKVGLFVAVEAARLCSEANVNVGVFAASTVQEEVGLRGARTAAYAIDPEVGIAIDVTFATDNPGTENPKAAPCKLGAGPAIVRGPNANPEVAELLMSAAKKHKIPHQLAPSPKLLGNDANAIQVSRAGVAAGSIGIPNRYMHTQVEVCDLVDLENSAKLLAHFARSITAKTDFRLA
ncbi:MAG: M42 family metallopeptidase [Bdellovibrionota bacterium]|nr:MAG: M42 family metallopeptidase [Bdellovibrionota bacterium]